MTTNSVNSNSFNEVFLQNSSKQENGTKVNTSYRNCIFELNDDNGIIERSDMIDDLENGTEKIGCEIYGKIQDFFVNNNGQKWTDNLKNEIVNLIKQFNSAEASKYTNVYDEQGRITQSTEYNPDGSLYETTSNVYDSRGNNIKTTIENNNGIQCTVENIYDSSDRVISSIEYDKNGNPSRRTVYNYANNGKIVKKEVSFYHDGKYDEPFVDVLEQGEDGEFQNVGTNKPGTTTQDYLNKWFQ